MDINLVVVNELIEETAKLLNINFDFNFRDDSINLKKAENRYEELIELKKLLEESVSNWLSKFKKMSNEEKQLFVDENEKQRKILREIRKSLSELKDIKLEILNRIKSVAPKIENSIAENRMAPSYITLPTLELPKFDGKSDNWLNF